MIRQGALRGQMTIMRQLMPRVPRPDKYVICDIKSLMHCLQLEEYIKMTCILRPGTLGMSSQIIVQKLP